MADLTSIDFITQVGLGGVALFAVRWGYSESTKRDAERAENQRLIAAERDGSARAIDKERAENARLQAEIMRMATDQAQTNALNRQTLADLKTSLETSKRGRVAPK